MYISTFKIHNYKGFLDPAVMTLKPGFNVFTGRNNAGKTALLECLSLKLMDSPHRSLKTLPSAQTPINNESFIDVSIFAEQKEINDLHFRESNFWIPLPAMGQGLDFSRSSKGVHDSSYLCSVAEWVLSKPQLEIQIRIVRDGSIRYIRRPTYGLYKIDQQLADNEIPYVVHMLTNGEVSVSGPTHNEGYSDFGASLASNLQGNIYRFLAERFQFSVSRFGHNTILAPNAANLPEVLNSLAINPHRFRRFNDYVRQIFPEIHEVTVRPVGNDHLEIVLWTEDPSTEREDLVIPLKESGTGIGHVLAMILFCLSRNVLIGLNE